MKPEASPVIFSRLQRVTVYDMVHVHPGHTHPEPMVMMAWHTLVDVGAADPFPDAIEPHEPDYALSIVVDKVHDGSAATIEQPRVTARPEWSATELSLLAHTLRAGIRRLADEIIPRGD